MFRKIAGNILASEKRGRQVLVCHQTNCLGVMGAGLAKQVRDTCPDVYTSYKRQTDQFKALRSIKGNSPTEGLGEVLFCPVPQKGFTIAATTPTTLMGCGPF